MITLMLVINVRTSRATADALGAAVAVEAGTERAWWADRRRELAGRVAAAGGRVPASIRAMWADELAAVHAGLRRTGRLRGTRTAYVLPALAEILAERGWAGREWRPVPPARAGRPWGTHDAGFDARVTLHLPDDLGQTLTRACYWASQPALAGLQSWYDTHGDHWRGVLHSPDTYRRWTGAGPSRAELAGRERLIGGVHTTGGVLRQAIHRALGTPDDGGKAAT